MCVCLWLSVCFFSGEKSERLVPDGVREVCSSVVLCAVGSGFQSLLSKPPMFKAVFSASVPSVQGSSGRTEQEYAI